MPPRGWGGPSESSGFKQLLARSYGDKEESPQAIFEDSDSERAEMVSENTFLKGKVTENAKIFRLRRTNFVI